MIEGRNFRLKRIPAALRGSGGGDIDPVQAALNRFDFHAPLTKSVLLSRGVGAASYTRATVATVKDFEGGIRNTLSGEVRFEGQRRVYNRVSSGTNTNAVNGGSWAATNCTLTPNSGTGPTGTSDASRLSAAASAWIYYDNISYTNGNRYVVSCWVKSNTSVSQTFRLFGSSSVISSDMTATTSWQRFSFSLTGLGAVNGGITRDSAGSAIDVLVWGWQVEDVTGQSNQNPSEYVSVGAAKLNELLYTEELGSLTPVRSTITANDATNPVNGAQTAEKIVEDATAANTHGVRTTTSAHVNGTEYTFSAYVKAGTRSWVYLDAVPSGAKFCYFDVANGVVGTASNATGSITDAGGGWYRCAITYTADGVAATNEVLLASADGGAIYNGDGASYAHVFGIQRVTGSSAGTYFPVGNVYPYHGACVDGVKYFDTENGNTVSGNVVTEAVGRSLDGYSVALLPGSSGAYFSTTTASFGVPTRYLLAEWTGTLESYTAASQALIGQYESAPNVSWLFLLEAGGTLRFFGSVDGTNNTDAGITASTVVTATAGRAAGFRCLKDFQTGDITFYQSLDGGDWSQLGTVKSGAAYSLFNSTKPITVGAYGAAGAAARATGKCNRARVWYSNNSTSTPLVDFNPREGWTENLLAQSEDFNTTWTKNNVTVSTNTIANPVDGAVTADKAVETAINSVHEVVQGFTTLSTTDPYELSVYAKAAERSWIALWLDGTAKGAYFDLTNGVIGTTSAGVTPTIQGLGNGWYRCKIVVTPTAAVSNFGVYIASADNSASYLGDITKGVYLFGTHFRRLSVASQRTTSQYLPTTTAALRGWISSTGEQWTINGAATVLQRQAEGYLPEGATTNLVLQSSNFGATWDSVGGGTPTRSAAAAYVGDVALDLLGDDDAAAAEYFRQLITFTADASKSVSFVVKQGSATTSLFKVSDDTAATARMTCEVTWSGGVPVATFSVGSQERPPEALANGAHRIFGLAAGVIAANANRIYVYPANTAAGSAAATGTVYVGGVQAENATVASSLMPTTTGTATRNVEYLTYPAAGNVSATQVALYGEIFALNSGTYRACITVQRAALTDRVELALPVAGAARGTTYAGGAAQADISAGTFSMGLNKFASRYAANDFQVAGNGTLGTPDVAGSMPTMTTIYLGIRSDSWPTGVPIKNLRIATVTLSNQELTLITR